MNESACCGNRRFTRASIPAVEDIEEAVDSKMVVATVEMAIRPTKAMVSSSFITLQSWTEKENAVNEQPKTIRASRSSRSGRHDGLSMGTRCVI